MEIVNHRLVDVGSPVRFVASPNLGGPVEPRYLVMHFTAGRGFESSVGWLANEAARASAHLVIGRNGEIAQLVPFDRIAWHAGVSHWDGLDGINRYSIGIELDNAGKLSRQGGRWRSWFGGVYPDDEVFEATHKHESEPAGWHIFTEAQIDAALGAAVAIARHYDIREVVGHEDIAPLRKVDPGPAFPMASFRARVLGRAEDLEVYETTAALNIRSGPGTVHPSLPGSPLPLNTRVAMLRQDGSWCYVDVLDPIDGMADLEGWVHGRYLRRANNTRV